MYDLAKGAHGLPTPLKAWIASRGDANPQLTTGFGTAPQDVLKTLTSSSAITVAEGVEVNTVSDSVAVGVFDDRSVAVGVADTGAKAVCVIPYWGFTV